MTVTPHLGTPLAATRLEDLTPHPRNPRNGDVEVIASSLAAHGQYRPIVVSRDGVILAGNHTYAAALALGWTEILTWRLDLDSNDPRATAILLADNRTSDLGRYDEGLLLDLLKEMPVLDGTGYTPDDLDDLLRLTAPAPYSINPDRPVSLEPDNTERAERYAQSGVRAVILTYPVEDWERVTDALNRARAHFHVDNNAEAVLSACEALEDSAG
jgi:hypothetical protein